MPVTCLCTAQHGRPVRALRRARLNVDRGSAHAIDGHFAGDGDEARGLLVAVGAAQAEEKGVVIGNDDALDILKLGCEEKVE